MSSGPPGGGLPGGGGGVGVGTGDGPFGIISGGCVQSGSCITSPNYPGAYPSDHLCEFTVTAGLPVYVVDFSIEPEPTIPCGFDYLLVDGIKYCDGNTAWPYSASNTTPPYFIPTDPVITFSSDDGTSQSGFNLCQYYPPSPPAVPSPPLSPPPPMPPPGLCSNTCEHAGDGVCDDGSPGSTSSSCPFATDCADCGVLTFCTDCPLACQERNAQLLATTTAEQALAQHGSKFCLQGDRDNQICEGGCNNLECGYNDCTAAQIVAQCVPAQELSGVDYSVSPGAAAALASSGQSSAAAGNSSSSTLEAATDVSRLTPMHVQLELEPARLSINDELNEVVLFQVFQYSLQWSDERLFSAPCYGALPEMLSMTKFDSLSDITRQRKYDLRKSYWIPVANFEPMMPGFDAFDEEAAITLPPGPATWLGIGPEQAPPTPKCEHCVEYVGEIEIQIVQNFELMYFPFDRQTISWVFQVPGANLFTCNGSDARDALQSMGIGATEAEATRALLPTNRLEWKLDGSFAKAVNVVHDNGDPQTCKIEVKVRRLWHVFLVKNMLLTILSAYAGLLGLYMHPGDMTGDRMAQLLVALLIIVTNLQADLGLGKLTNIMWIDYFNLAQMALLILAVIEGLLVHHYCVTQREKYAIQLDLVFRFAFPFILYPYVTLGSILWGALHDDGLYVFVAMLVVGVPIFCYLTYHQVQRNLNRFSIDLAACVKAVRATPHSDPAFEGVLMNLFRVVDLDNSGSLDQKELRELFNMTYPDATRQQIADALLAVRRYADADNELDADSFYDSMMAVEKELGDSMMKTDTQSGSSKRAISISNFAPKAFTSTVKAVSTFVPKVKSSTAPPTAVHVNDSSADADDDARAAAVPVAEEQDPAPGAEEAPTRRRRRRQPRDTATLEPPPAYGTQRTWQAPQTYGGGGQLYGDRALVYDDNGVEETLPRSYA